MNRRVPLGAALFFALLTATLIVAVLAVRARSPDLVLEVTRGLPTEITRGEEARIEFFVREDEPAARVAIVDAEEDLVRTLDERVALASGEETTYRWDGRTDAGLRVNPGRYRLLVELPGSDREMVWPRRITISAGIPQPDVAP